tara:strand:+ start:645 stop:1259 length:615 start_codon:yes stop_codon:yes gene_type:complete
MKDNFEKALEMVLKHEGGFVDHPQDPGGATNKGITLATYEDFLHNTIGPEVMVTVDDLKEIPQDDVEEIYKKNYWDKVWGEQLPHGLDFAMFDFAVNSGPARAVRELQKVFWECKTDGVMGPKTFKNIWDPEQLMAWKQIEVSEGTRTLEHFKQEEIKSTIERLMENRKKFLKTLKHYEHFCRGWDRRCDETKEAAELLCENIK